jgi:hypothetical protein
MIATNYRTLDQLKAAGLTGPADGVWTIEPPGPLGPFQVLCDMTNDGGGWVVAQQRLPDGESWRTGRSVRMDR